MGRKQARLDRWHLIRLARTRPLRRAERRNLRWKLGRDLGVEWRSFGNVRRRDGSYAPAADALNHLIFTNAKQQGHLAQQRAMP